MTNAKNETGSAGYTYGSVNNDEETGAASENNNDNDDFDESNLYYYKEETLTRREKAIKIVKFTVPILIAVLLIGGLTFLLFHNFAKLYPGPGTQRIPSGGSRASHTDDDDDGGIVSPFSPPIPVHSVPTIMSASTKKKATKKATSSSDSSSSTKHLGSSCSLYPKCLDLGLTGECCPTTAGGKLDCCN